MFQHDNYDDIIDLPHPTSKTHPRMSLHDRAAQFSPFAALTGHDDAIIETARLVEEKYDLDEDQKLHINQTLNHILSHINDHPYITINYFQPDVKKSGGMYLMISDNVKKVDEYHQLIILENGTTIAFENIYTITEVKSK